MLRAPGAPRLVGKLGGVLGVTEPPEEATPPDARDAAQGQVHGAGRHPGDLAVRPRAQAGASGRGR
ncbi:hypothetical protein [Streptomyces sp. PBH53]|uniref:hypothetical protein n=1 Tax=Streptomyces sp. PBH53 TaxID=1577075 RepID=UPI000A9EE773|nr:hypothetical protein [Streptomyces sp. PBH53]